MVRFTTTRYIYCFPSVSILPAAYPTWIPQFSKEMTILLNLPVSLSFCFYSSKMPPPGPDPRSTNFTFFFFLISISKCLRFRPQPVHGLQPLLNPNALPNSLACFWSSTVLGRIIAPKDVHVLIPETWNMLFDMAKGTLQVWLS